MTSPRKPRLGRPPSPPEQLQTRGAYVRGTEAQHAAWAAAAAAEGVPVAEWHRRLADAAVGGVVPGRLMYLHGYRSALADIGTMTRILATPAPTARLTKKESE